MIFSNCLFDILIKEQLLTCPAHKEKDTLNSSCLVVIYRQSPTKKSKTWWWFYEWSDKIDNYISTGIV